MTPDVESYEIIIDDLNGYTSIRGVGNDGNLVTKRIGRLLSCFSPRYFWISYFEMSANSTQYIVKLGRGSSPSRNTLLEGQFSKVKFRNEFSKNYCQIFIILILG